MKKRSPKSSADGTPPREEAGVEEAQESDKKVLHPLEVMRNVYQQLEITFQEDDGMISTHLNLVNVAVQVISWGEPDDLASVVVKIPVRAAPKFRAAAGEFLHRLNYGSKRKFWEIDYNDGEIRMVCYTDISGCKLPVVSFKTTLENFNLGHDGQMLLVYGVRASTDEIEQTLGHLASKRSAEPVMLLLQDEEERATELRDHLARVSPKMAPRLVIVSLTGYLVETLTRFGLLGTAFSTSDMKTGHFNAGLARARDVLKDAMRNWRQDVLDQQGLILSPLFYGSKVSDDQIEIFARGYAAMLNGSNYQDVCQTGTGPFTAKERDDFQKLVERQVDPNVSPKKDHGSLPQLRLITKPGAEEIAEVPRAIVAIIQRCSRSGVALNTLEKDFFFEFPAAATLNIKRADIIRQSIHLLKCLGLVEQDQNTIRQISKPALETQITGASQWLEGRFEQAANRIRAIHLDEGDNLIDVRAKVAKHGLKDALARLEDLSLDFIGKSWKELNKVNAGLPVYEERLRMALGVITQVSNALTSVYDPDRDRAFSYVPEAIQEFQQMQAGATYPLWKRIKILEGFYKEVEERRKGLLKRIDGVRHEVDSQVPDLPDGKKALPTQAITMPLELFSRELNFSADHPNRTITVGECASGRVLAITEMFGQVELIQGYCREAVVDQWGVCCIYPFHRVSDVACTRSWAQQDKESLMIYRRVRVHLVAEEPWMKRPA